MRAFIQTHYGPPSVLTLKEISIPQPKINEVQIKIISTAINDWDWSMVRGTPIIYRLMFGVFKPKNPIPGMEISGQITALGENSKKFNVGDYVFGDLSDYGFGGFSEYVCINENALIGKPEKMSFQDACAIPHASLLAYQGLIDYARLNREEKVLINGAGGGLGTFGLQIAKEYSCHVTGVDSGPKLPVLKSMGYDNVIDYQLEDFTKNGERYDVILDAKTNRSPWAYLNSLKSGGRYVTVGGSLTKMILLLLSQLILKKAHGKEFSIVALKPNQGLDEIIKRYEGGIIKPTIDGPYSFEEIPQLIQYFGEGRHQGKVVVNISKG